MMYEAKIAEQLSQREQLEKRMEEYEKEIAEKESRIVGLEEEKFAWERERKGLRWLVTTGRMGDPNQAEQSVQLQITDSDATAVSEEGKSDYRRSFTMPAHLSALPSEDEDQKADPSAKIVVVSTDGVKPAPQGSNPSSSIAASRPLSMISQVSATSSRTSMDDQLLHVRTTSGQSNLKRHSMYEAGASSAATVGRRPLSAALEDMVRVWRLRAVETFR